jgi:hypothetical protein
MCSFSDPAWADPTGAMFYHMNPTSAASLVEAASGGPLGASGKGGYGHTRKPLTPRGGEPERVGHRYPPAAPVPPRVGCECRFNAPTRGEALRGVDHRHGRRAG